MSRHFPVTRSGESDFQIMMMRRARFEVVKQTLCRDCGTVDQASGLP
jgi:hypothetical protein